MSTSLTIIQGIISKDEDRYSRRPRCFARCYRQCPRYDTEDVTRSNAYDTGLTYLNLGYLTIPSSRTSLNFLASHRVYFPLIVTEKLTLHRKATILAPSARSWSQ